LVSKLINIIFILVTRYNKDSGITLLG
jgi:hypothetical protein